MNLCFNMFQVNAEFTLITTVPLFPTFMSQLDHYSSQLMRVFKKKGGTARRDIDVIIAEMDKVCVLGVFCALTPGGLTFTLNIIMLFLYYGL